MADLSNYSIEEVKNYSSKYKLNLEIKYEYNDIKKDSFISQIIVKNTKIKKNDKLIVTFSLGQIPTTLYKKKNVNELGNIPIMMYHGIQNLKDSDTSYTGGNIDKDGYNRTSESFRRDLEFYYNNGYRMIRLDDYINGDINTELGYSPLILTFDDGLSNNLLVTGENSDIIIDPNSAVGILEEFKKKYSDFNVTATFFVNCQLFNQEKYNEKILKWLVSNGYDVGNHTCNHVNFSNIDSTKSLKEIASVYKELDKIIPNKYVNIIALPYGSPYKKSHSNFEYILNGTYEGYTYKTDATLRVGWESEVSPFSKSFDKTFLKRIRAYDHDGTEFDIEMNFKMLKNKRYISDGNKDTVTVPNNMKELVNSKKEI